MSGTQPWPIPPLNIPEDFCNPPSTLNWVVEGVNVKLFWIAPHDNEGILIKYWMGVDTPSTLIAYASGVMLSLQPNTLYNWSLTTICNLEANRYSSEIVGVPFVTGDSEETLNCSPIDMNNAVVIVSDNTARFEWPSIPNIKFYTLELFDTALSITNKSVPFITSKNYFTYFLLKPQTKYAWRVKPECAGSVYSSFGFFETSIESAYLPLKLTIRPLNNKVIVTWPFDKNIEQINVYINNELELSVKTNNNMIKLENLEPDTTYYITVVPYYKGLTGNPASGTFNTRAAIVNPPTNLNIIQNGTDLNITWSKPQNITGFELTVNGTLYNLLSTESTATISIGPSLNYNISLKSIRGTYKSTEISKSFKTTEFVETPKDLTISNLEYNKVLITWVHSRNTDHYLYTYYPIGASATAGITNLTQVLLEGLSPSTNYLFNLRSANKDGAFSPTLSISFMTPARPAAPIPDNIEYFNLQSTSFGVKFDYNPFNEYQYELIVRDTLTNTIVADIITTSNIINVEGLNPETVYNYQLLNITNPALYSYSNIVEIKTNSAMAALVAEAFMSGTDLLITWDVDPVVDHYVLKIKLVNESSFTDVPIVTPGSILLPNMTIGVYVINLIAFYYVD